MGSTVSCHLGKQVSYWPTMTFGIKLLKENPKKTVIYKLKEQQYNNFKFVLTKRHTGGFLGGGFGVTWLLQGMARVGKLPSTSLQPRPGKSHK